MRKGKGLIIGNVILVVLITGLIINGCSTNNAGLVEAINANRKAIVELRNEIVTNRNTIVELRNTVEQLRAAVTILNAQSENIAKNTTKINEIISFINR